MLLSLFLFATGVVTGILVMVAFPLKQDTTKTLLEKTRHQLVELLEEDITEYEVELRNVEGLLKMIWWKHAR